MENAEAEIFPWSLFTLRPTWNSLGLAVPRDLGIQNLARDAKPLSGYYHKVTSRKPRTMVLSFHGAEPRPAPGAQT